jgi:hypothetical protein
MYCYDLVKEKIHEAQTEIILVFLVKKFNP